MGERAFVVTQSIKKLNAQDRQLALDTKGFKSLYDDKVVDLAKISKDDETIYYKNTPYTPKDLPQRLIITYSPKYTKYQKSIREKQVDRAKLMLEKGSIKKERRNPNNPARFLGIIAVTDDGETANVYNYLNTEKIDEICHFNTDFEFITKSQMRTIQKQSKGK